MKAPLPIPLARPAPVTLDTPTTGRQFAALRISLGLSGNAVANALGVFATTLARLEASSQPLPAIRRDAWLTAIRRGTARRMRDLQRLGLSPADLPTNGLGELLAIYRYDGQGDDAA